MNMRNNSVDLSILLKLKLKKTIIKNTKGTNFGISKEFKKENLVFQIHRVK